MKRKWTGRMDLALRRHYPACKVVPALAAQLGVTMDQLRRRAKTLGVRRLKHDGSGEPFRRPWTDAERQAVRERYGKEPASRIAADLGRRVSMVQAVAWDMGLSAPQKRWTAQHDELLKRLNAEGLSDTEAGERMGFDRHRTGDARKRLGLASNARGERWLGKIRASVAGQLGRMGLPSTAHLKAQAHRRYAEENGWPRELRPRHVQILNLLAEAGVPLVRRQIAEGIGMPWKGARASLTSNDPSGTYLSHLAGLGLVLVLPRQGPPCAPGGGRRLDLYCLGPSALAILEERARKGATA